MYKCGMATAACEGQCFCELYLPHSTAHDSGFCDVREVWVCDYPTPEQAMEDEL